MKENAVVEKSFDFAIRIVKLYKFLKQEHKEYTLSRQLLRCGTSIGANVSEAQKAQSKAGFSARMYIVLKEANEADYWLRLLHRTDFLTHDQFDSLNTDVQELISLLTSICKSASIK